MSGQGKRLRVLVVDDSLDAAKSLAMMVETMGHQASFSTQPIDTLPLIARFKPHVVFLDLGMPVLNGYQVAQHVRRRYGEKPRLIAITGYAAPSDRAMSRTVGFDLHLVKPASPELIKEVLDGVADEGGEPS